EEGSASISDENGNLQFYTDGVSVYKNTHEQMPSNDELLGGNYSTQSALIVPKPGDQDRYYIFTVSEIRFGNQVFSEGDGLNYYVVNMGAAGGSLNSLKTHLVTYDSEIRGEQLLKCSQKLTAIKDPCEDVYWIVTHFEDTFYSFKIDKNGVKSAPVTSQIGPYIHLGAHIVNSRGQLKISPDGTKLAMANFQNSIDSSGHSPGSLYLFDFDIATGKVTNAKKLMENDFVFAYGAEFSADSKKLYSTLSSFRNGEVPPSGHNNDGSSLFQIDLEDNYRTTRLFSSTEEPMALQLAIDGKIYKAHQGSRLLGVVNNPKERGMAANYEDAGLSIGRPSKTGLPSFVQSYFQVRIDYKEACEGELTKLSTNYLPDPDRLDWDFGDGNKLSNTLDKNPVHVYQTAGSYLAKVTITKGSEVESYSKLVEVKKLPIVSPVTLTQCDDDGDGIANFNLHEVSDLINPDPTLKYSFFYSQEDAENKENGILGITYFFSNELASRIYVRVESEFGCDRITTIDLEVLDTAIPDNFMLNFNTCDDFFNEKDTDGIGTFDFSGATESILGLFPADRDLTVTYYRTSEDALAEIRAINPTNFRNDKSPFVQNIWVRVDGTEDNACVGLGHHITLIVDSVPQFELEKQMTICRSQLPYTLNPINPSANYTYQWTDEVGNLLSAEPILAIQDAGNYTLTATNTDGTGCTSFKNIDVEAIAPPIISEIVVDGIISNISTATVQLENTEGFEFALDDANGPFQESNIFQEVEPGIHKAYVRDKNQCELVVREFSVIGHPAFFTPNNDGVNDFWQIQGVSKNLQADSDIYIYDRYGLLLSQVNPSSKGWDGTFLGKLLPESDYWFRVALEDGRQFSGHFTLKR
ncbi:MAG: T9SS type B sorting domain-containing protein, partial [Aurantibacter sp.]